MEKLDYGYTYGVIRVRLVLGLDKIKTRFLEREPEQASNILLPTI